MKRILALLLIGCLMLCNCAFAAAPEPAAEPEETTVITEDAAESEGEAEAWLFIGAASGGPEVQKIIVEFAEPFANIEASGIDLYTADVHHAVDNVYLCNREGNAIDGESVYAAFDIGEVIRDEEEGGSDSAGFMSGSLFSRDESAISVWADTYQVRLTAESFVTDKGEFSLNIDENCINNRICPAAEQFNYRSEVTGNYVNPYTGEEEEMTIHMAAYQPESLDGGEKNPLIIWLHGQGEGGVDPDITILGNEVSALAQDPIQSYFTAGDEIGAYILVPQTKTYWKDEGYGTNGSGSGISRYTEVLHDAILKYLEDNPDVDQNRVYIGGCSNGGYMTMHMLITYPKLFAAAYPLCPGYSYYLFERDEEGKYIYAEQPDSSGGQSADTEAAEEEAAEEEPAEGGSSDDYAGDSDEGESAAEPVENTPSEDGSAEGDLSDNTSEVEPVTGYQNAIVTENGIWLTEDKIERIKDIPMWFVCSADDTTDSAFIYDLPTYTALIQAGAQHCYITLFETAGHFVWVPFFQNTITGVQDPTAVADITIPSARDSVLSAYNLIPDDETGGAFTADGYDNIFAWLNAQSK